MIKSKIKGALYGIAVGDALGAPFEGWRPKSIEFFFNKHRQKWTNLLIF